ncbi:right-handed parallel beta-helix repeat-containing protein [Tautonia sociabilis]|uniref:Right-handed parallel beta-helix repeat-containing protein n=1 Tax=Tautonia sociabilis TaxID=2080755 RepID=A0A432MED8_9BACT|nr:right-handed parallel beta-helix repeat-containing protein [Tautonia sociabilis]RUL83670.1 hypothetical protein TsocGM_21805 [Tautonia sociabilis]
MRSSWWKRIGAAPGDRGASGGRALVRARAIVPRPEALEPRQLLATFTVTSPADSGEGSLRDAIEQANRSREKDTIEFAPSAGDAIVLTAPLPALRGELDITGPSGNPVTISRDPSPETPEFRILTIAEDAVVKLEWLVISGGRADLGGGIFNQGSLVMNLCTVSGNTARFQGGGIYNEHVFGSNQATISGNVVEADATLGFGPSGVGRGGGLYNAGHVTLQTSSIVGNRANREGGGIYNINNLTLRTCTVSNNVAEGFIIAGGQVPAGRGGGIFNAQTLTIRNSTIAENRANRIGGGIFSNLSRGVPATVVPVRIETPTIQSSIVAGNPGGDLDVQTGPFESLGNNLFGTPPDIPTQPSDRVGVDPLLAPLADYGNSILLHALLPGSPAIDAGVYSESFPKDPRGVDRPRDATDIGAFESRGVDLTVVSGSGQSAPSGSPFPEPLVVSVSPRDDVPAAGGVVIFSPPAAGSSAIVSGNPVVIDSRGLASVQAVAGDVPGSYTVAAVSGGDRIAGFSLTNTSPPPSALGDPPPASSSSVIAADPAAEPAPSAPVSRQALPRPSRPRSPARTLRDALRERASRGDLPPSPATQRLLAWAARPSP